MIRLFNNINLELDDRIASDSLRMIISQKYGYQQEPGSGLIAYARSVDDMYRKTTLIELLKKAEQIHTLEKEDEFFIYCDLESYVKIAAIWLKTINKNIDEKTAYLFVKSALAQANVGPRKNMYSRDQERYTLDTFEWGTIWNETQPETDKDFVKHARTSCDVSFHLASYLLDGKADKLQYSIVPFMKSALEKCLVEVKESIAYNILDNDLQEAIFTNHYDIYNMEDYWLDPSPIVKTFFDPNLWKYPKMIIPSTIGGRVFFEKFTDQDIDNVKIAYQITGHDKNEDIDFKCNMIRMLRDGIKYEDVAAMIEKEKIATKFNEMDTELFIAANCNRMFVRHLLNNELANDKSMFEACAI